MTSLDPSINNYLSFKQVSEQFLSERWLAKLIISNAELGSVGSLYNRVLLHASFLLYWNYATKRFTMLYCFTFVGCKSSLKEQNYTLTVLFAWWSMMLSCSLHGKTFCMKLYKCFFVCDLNIVISVLCLHLWSFFSTDLSLCSWETAGHQYWLQFFVPSKEMSSRQDTSLCCTLTDRPPDWGCRCLYQA